MLDTLVANIWYQLMQIINYIYLPSSSWIQLLVLMRATCCNGFKFRAVVQPKILSGVIKNMDTSRCSFISRNVHKVTLFCYNGIRVPESSVPVLQHTLLSWVAEPFSQWEGTNARQKNYRRFVVWIGNCDVTGIEIWGYYPYTIWRSKLYYFRQSKPLWKRIGEPPEIQTGCYNGDPGRAGLRGRGATGQLPRTPDARGSPSWNLYVSNKILVWKIFVIHKRHRNTAWYYIPLLR